jgi:predicted NBD/HSP70 family sugar kinase
MIIVIDIGGSRMRVAKCDVAKGAIVGEPIIEPTPKTYKEGVARLRELVVAAAAGDSISDIVVGMPGVVDTEHGKLLASPHLGDWANQPFADDLDDDTPVHVVNDADLVGLGEAMFGSGKGFDIVVYITISTGIGGAKIVSGRLEKNRFGFEPGFQILDAKTGATFESLCSGSAVEATYKTHPRVVAKTMAWEEIERVIGVGLHNCIVHWSPDVLVVGGSMANDLDAERLRAQIASHPSPHPRLPAIKIAALDSIGGLYGGIAYLRSR